MPLKTAIIFDCQEMPENVKRAFMDYTRGDYCNDVWIEWYFDQWDGDPRGECAKIINAWIEAQGVVRPSIDSNDPFPTVLIKHWW